MRRQSSLPSQPNRRTMEPQESDLNWEAAFARFEFPHQPSRTPTGAKSRFGFNNEDLISEITKEKDIEREHFHESEQRSLYSLNDASPFQSQTELPAQPAYNLPAANLQEPAFSKEQRRSSTRLSRRISAVLGKSSAKTRNPRRASDFTDLLCDAAASGRWEYIGRILGAGGDFNKKNSDGLTPLHVAAMAGHGTVVKSLVHSGADINAKDSQGYTALHRAVMSNRVHLIQWLGRLGANLEAKDSIGQTALHLAAQQHGGISETVSHSHRDSQQSTLRFSYVFGGRNSAADRESYASTGSAYEDCTLVEALLRAGADKEARDRRGDTPLHMAVAAGDLYNASTLIDYGSNLNVRNKAKLTPLGVLAASGEENDTLSRLLLDKGAAVTPIDRKGGFWVGRAVL